MAEINHGIINIFRSSTHPVNKNVREIIDVKNSILYLFDETSGYILVTNSSSFTGLGDVPERYQVFDPRIRVYGKARALRASENNVRVAVFTDLGLYVVDLPHIWTCLMLPRTSSSTNVTMAEVWMVSPEVERMHKVFVYEVMQVRWHPRQHNYLLALYNDNFLRLMDTETHTLLRVLSLGRHPSSALSTLIPLHEHTVDFDFAPKSGESNREEAAVLLLTGTGDVSHAVISREKIRLDEPMCVKTDSKSSGQNIGPLNVVFCSLVVLHCYPTVVVMSTKTGLVSHCLMLGEQNGSTQYLKVFEQYDLSRARKKKHKLRPYLLLKDPGSIYRYFVLHAAGVHAVMLPLIPLLEHLLAQELVEGVEEKMKIAVRDTESIVRHLVNTQLAEMTKPRPAFGVGAIPVRVTQTKLLVLLADSRATLHSVDYAFPPVTDYFYKPFTGSKEPRKQFSAVLSNYLLGSKSSRPPVLKVGEALKSTSPEAALQFLRNYFSHLKEDRIKKHYVVAELIEAKVQDIAIEFNCQQKQLMKLRYEKESLQQHAERIAEQYEETNENHELLQKRLEMIGLRLNAPGKSVSEEKMRTELVALKEKTDKLQFALFQTQALYEHRKTQEQNPNQPEVQHRPLYLNEQRRTRIKQSLEEMSENIQEMKYKINRLNVKLNFMQ